MANILELLGGLAQQQKQTVPTLDLTPTPAQRNFDPDKQRIEEYLASLGAQLAEDQTPAFFNQGGVPLPQPPATAQTNNPFGNGLPDGGVPQQLIQAVMQGQLNPPAEQADPAQGETALEKVIMGVVNTMLGGNLTEQPAQAPQQAPAGKTFDQRANALLAAMNPTTSQPDAFTGATVKAPASQPSVNDSAQTLTEEVKKALPTIDFDMKDFDLGKADPATLKKVEKSFFEKQEFKDLLLGFGTSLLRGDDINRAIANGIEYQQKAAMGRKAGEAQGVKDATEIDLKKSQTRKNLAEAKKLAAEAGGKGKILKDYIKQYQSEITNIMPGDPTEKAVLNTLQVLKADNPDSPFIQNLERSTIDNLLSRVFALEDVDAQKEALRQLAIDYPSINLEEELKRY